MKILIIASFPPPYHGASIYVKKLTEALLSDGKLDIYVIDTSDHRDDLNNLGKLDFLNIYSALKSIFRLTITLLKNKIDIVYIPISQSILAYFRDAIFILISKFLRSKVVIHLNGSYFKDFYEKSPWFYKKIIDISIKKVDGAIVLGEKLRYIFRKWLPDKKIYVLPNFIEWSFEITEDLKTKFNRNDQLVVISYLGNLVVSKGIFDLLNAIEIIKNKTTKQFVLKIAGQFGRDPIENIDERNTEIMFFEKLKQIGDDIVEFIGKIRDERLKFDFLLNSHVFVFPSWYWYEGQPLVILEAMSCGCPIISTKGVGVIDETVIDDFNGILVEKKNPEMLADAILKLLENDELRLKMGSNSAKRYAELFTSKKHLAIFKAILTKIVN